MIIVMYVSAPRHVPTPYHHLFWILNNSWKHWYGRTFFTNQCHCHTRVNFTKMAPRHDFWLKLKIIPKNILSNPFPRMTFFVKFWNWFIMKKENVLFCYEKKSDLKRPAGCVCARNLTIWHLLFALGLTLLPTVRPRLLTGVMWQLTKTCQELEDWVEPIDRKICLSLRFGWDPAILPWFFNSSLLATIKRWCIVTTQLWKNTRANFKMSLSRVLFGVTITIFLKEGKLSIKLPKNHAYHRSHSEFWNHDVIFLEEKTVAVIYWFQKCTPGKNLSSETS